MRRFYNDDDDNYRRIRILERILRDEKADSVKRLLALIGLTQFALRRPPIA